MKKISILITVAFVFMSIARLNAQDTGGKYRITGTVFENNTSKGLEGAAVRILSAKDSSFVIGSASDALGKYTLSVKKVGKYILQTSFLGYETNNKDFEINKNESHTVINIHLKEQTVQLDETVIQGKVPDIVLKQDTMEFNADSYKVKEGSPIEDLIRKLPGVQISSDGKILVEGKEINEILVDGRKFFGNDQSITLKNLPADMVNKVQIIDKKSKEEEVTGFSTEEKEKVLNLTIKPDKKKGLFGFGTAGYGTKNRYMLRAMANSFLGEDKLSVIVNTRNLQGDANVGAGSYLMGDPTQEEVAANINKEFKKGMNLDGSIGFKHNTDKDISSRSSQNLLPDSVYYTNSNSDSRNWGRSMHSNLRFEYKQDTTMNILIQPNFSYSNRRSNSINYAETLDGNMKAVNESNSTNRGFTKSADIGLTTFFNRRLSKKGRSINLEFNISNNNSNGDLHNLSDNFFFRESGDSIVNLDQKRLSDNSNLNYMGRVAYVEPIGKSSSLRLSYTFTQTISNNENNTYAWNGEDYSTLDSLYSRSTKSNRVSQPVMLDFRSKIKNISYSLGMGVDPSRQKEDTYVGNTTLKEQHQTLLNYSPRMTFMWKNKKGYSLNMHYFGRSNLPTTRQLSPVLEIISPVLEMQGNPDLKAGFSHRMSASGRFYNRKSQFSAALYSSLSVQQNAITSYSIYNAENGKNFTSYRNVNGNWATNNNLMFNFPFKNKKLQMGSVTGYSFNQRTGFTNGQENRSKNNNISQNVNLNYFDEKVSFGFEGRVNYSGVRNSLKNLDEQNTWDYGTRVNVQVEIPWSISLSTVMNYVGKSGFSKAYNRQIVTWDAQVSKKLLKNNMGEIAIVVLDILQQANNTSRNISATSITDNSWNTIGSFAMLKFTYRFNHIFGSGAVKNADPSTNIHMSPYQGRRMHFY